MVRRAAGLLLAAALATAGPGEDKDLWLASGDGDVAKVQELLHGGASVAAVFGYYGATPLHESADKGHVEVSKELLLHEPAADVNARNFWGLTPLHLSAWSGHVEVSKELLLNEPAPDVNARDDYGRTPLHYSAAYGHSEVSEELLLHRPAADANVRDTWGWTPLLHAAWRSKETCGALDLLCHAEAVDMLVQTPYGRTAYELTLIASVHKQASNRDGNKSGRDNGAECPAVLEKCGGNPGLFAMLKHSIISEPWIFTCALLGGFGSGAIAAAVLSGGILVCPRTEEGSPLNDPSDNIPAGAQLLVAQQIVKKRQGRAKSLLRRQYIVLEICQNFLIVFGPGMYFLSPRIVLPLWLAFFALPAALIFGPRRVISNPALLASTGYSTCLRMLACFRCMLLISALFVVGDAPYDVLAIDPALDELLHVVLVRNPALEALVDTHYSDRYWYDKATRSTFFASWTALCVISILTAIGGVIAVAVRCRSGALAADDGRRQVRALAAEIARAADADAIADIGRGEEIDLKPIILLPRSPLDLGLMVRVILIAVDVLSDLYVMLNLLSRQHYQFFGVMLSIFTASFASEVFNRRGLRSIRAEMRKTLKKGYMSKGLLSIIHREAGWEAFGQLAVTTYALAFLTYELRPLIISMLSMVLSCWTLSGHLYELVDLGEIMEAEIGEDSSAPDDSEEEAEAEAEADEEGDSSASDSSSAE